MTLAEDLPPTSSATAELTIEGIEEPVVLRYFETFNRGDFYATAALFAESGALYPPFEDPIVGAEAIVTYLEAEAPGMKVYPRQGIVNTLEDDTNKVQVSGKVETRWFCVNVSWLFVLNQEDRILSATIKLLASPQELLNLRR